MALVLGTKLDDTLSGTDGIDTIRGFRGNDILSGLAGNDLIAGGHGNDTLQSGGNGDTLEGGPGNDHIEVTYIGPTRVSGGAGKDVVVVDASGFGSASVKLVDWKYDEAEGVTASAHTQDGGLAPAGGGTGTSQGSASEPETIFVKLELVVATVGATNFKMLDIETLHAIGGGGDDTIEGLWGNDLLVGNDGNDVLHGNFGSDTLIGGEGNDTLWSASGDMRFLGGAGDDIVALYHESRFEPGRQFLDGGTGADHLLLEIDDDQDLNMAFIPGRRSEMSNGMVVKNFEYLDLTTGDGNDTLKLELHNANGYYNWNAGGGDNFAIVDISAFSGAVAFYADLGTRELPEEIFGPVWSGPNIDFHGVSRLRLYGNDDVNHLYGNLSHDYLFGAGGDDRLVGEIGADSLDGGNGNDELDGGAGNDLLSGGNQNDSLFGGQGNDVLLGGNGADWQSGGDGTDRLQGNQGNDRLAGGDGADTAYGGDGTDALGGGSGDDHLGGGTGDDRVFGGLGNDVIYGGSGADVLFGGKDNDSIQGGLGNDTLIGGTGSDRLAGGSDKNVLTGGAGVDFFVYAGRSGQNRITDFEIGVDKIDFSEMSIGFDDLVFSQQDGYVSILLDDPEAPSRAIFEVADLNLADIMQESHFLF
ncbi:calcium-binding protein [Ruegeria hyattellae]|uniref:calcium-binding protein n=1 Tax=Ruegeria hyattellae TaxID=3233337 RepID=UPI00355B878C